MAFGRRSCRGQHQGLIQAIKNAVLRRQRRFDVGALPSLMKIDVRLAVFEQ
jgi:hypothetical protein